MQRAFRVPVLVLVIVSYWLIPWTASSMASARESALQAAPETQTAHSTPLPQLVEKDGRYALLVDGNPYLMLGGQINNSSAWPAMLPKVWPAIERLHCNTVEMPVYWEQFEPEPGRFDDSSLHTLLDQARQHHVHLVLLWFGTWKNGNLHYTPEWIKTNNARYPRMIDSLGRTLDSLSPFGTATLEADKTAFRTLMQRLKAADPQHTVILVQVENEPGVVGGVRDFSPAAQKIFDSPVPAALTKALGKPAGTWAKVFGEDADESFGAWAIARYINEVAAAGKSADPLPMYVNAWLRDPLYYQPPGSYDTGGATDNMLPIWKATVSIDLIAPDIYKSDYARYKKVLDLYRRPDNAMFVPETGRDPEYARYFFAALGNGTIGFSPFAMDEVEDESSPLRGDPTFISQISAIYQAIAPMDVEVARLNFEGKLQAVAQNPELAQQTLNFGPWNAVVSYGLAAFGSGKDQTGKSRPDGGAMVAQLGPDEFLVTAVDARVDFHVADWRSSRRRLFLRVEEGTYEKGVWHFQRLWNGDQTDYGLNFLATPRILKVRVGSF